MNIITYLLLLDFSGSMDQVINNQVKIDILKEQTTALISTENKDEKNHIIYFGSNPQKKCNDILNQDVTASSYAGAIKKIHPGAFGKSPLAQSLKSAMTLLEKENIKNTIVVTDGADTCGGDPCAVLEKENDILKKMNKKIKINIIGFDLKSEKSKFTCFKNLNLSQIDISLNEADSSSDMLNILKKKQSDDIDDGDALSDQDTDAIKGLKKFKVKNKGDDKSKQNIKKNKNKNKENNNTDLSYLEIVGAPVTAKFNALGKAEQKNWLGPFATTLNPGSYEISYENPNGKSLKLSVAKGSHIKLPWAQLLKNSMSQLNEKNLNFSLKWTPDETTTSLHGGLEPQFTRANTNSDAQVAQSIPFGHWTVEVESPPWLKGKIQQVDYDLKLSEKTNIDWNQVYSQQIVMIENPSPSKNMILYLKNDNGTEERYLIPPGQKNIPISKQSKAEWLYPR